ncbi:MAG: D-glycerate dehydrogenase [bacterium]|nr:D-glycerate dehydrogenase [bacterium]
MKTRFKVYVTRIIPEEGLGILKRDYDVEIWKKDMPIPKSELIKKVKDVDALLSLLTDTIDAEVMDAAPRLKVISNYAVGYNNIDIKAATDRGIVVTNTPGVLTETTADFAWCLLMACARRLVEADRFTREGKFKGWEPTLFLGVDVFGKTLGIIGFGRIGQAVAKRAKGFNMNVLYYDKIPISPQLEQELGVKRTSLQELLKKSDFITLHVDLNADTRHMINADAFKLMKPTAILINTSRGPVVDEKELYNALKTKRILYAGLDVYEEEPKIYKGLEKLDNVILAPHIASATYETRSKMAVIAAENIVKVLKGKKPQYVVNTEVFRKKEVV